MKKVISVLCTVSLLLSAIFIVPFSAFAESDYDVVDDYSFWMQGLSKVGSWDLFSNHSEIGLSLAGRSSTASENSLIYSFEGKKITGIKVDVAEATGFFGADDLIVSAYANDNWQSLPLTRGEEVEIPESTNNAFKSMAVTADTVPSNTTKVKVTLNNPIAWTLLLDKVSFKTADYDPASDVFEGNSYTDDFDSNFSLAQKTGSFICSNPHSEIGISVYTRGDTTTESSLTYNFKGKKITNFNIFVAEATGYFGPDDLAVSTFSDGEWSNVALTRGEEITISSATTDTFKSMNITPNAIPENTTKIKVSLANPIAWTLHLDQITFTLADAQIKPVADDKYIDDFSSLDTVSKKTGNWISYGSHPEFGASVFGRYSIDEENTVYYYFGDKSLTKIDVDVVIYHGFFNDSDIEISVSNNGVNYTTVPMSVSLESDIKDYESSNFKSATITANEIPENSHWLSITLKNNPGYTLFLDNLTAYGVSEVCKAYNEQTLYFTNSSGTKLKYYLTAPSGYDGKTKLPLVLFMHGVGGDTETSGYTFLRDKLFSGTSDCILLAPIADSTENQWWISQSVLGNIGTTGIYGQDDLTPTPALLAARDLLKNIKNSYNVDSSRIYAIGVSMGGFATYELSTRYPELFSAIAPICGGCDPTKAEVIKDIPIWSFHGDADTVVNVDADRAMASALVTAGNENAKYTEYEGFDHGIWFEAMGNSGLIPWLFSQSKATDYSENYAYEFDHLTDWSVATSHSDTYTLFANQTDINDSALTSTESQYGENYIEYNFDNKEITEVYVDTGFHSEYANAENLWLTAKTSGSDTWHTVSATSVFNTELSNSLYVISTLSYKGLPKNTVSIRIGVNPTVVNWTYFINNVSVKHKQEEKVYQFETGDINKDGTVNILDLVSMKKFIAAKTVDLIVDVDGNGTIDAYDLQALILHIIGKEQLESQEKIEKLRNAATLKAFADNDLIFLAATQLKNGAFPTYNGAAGEEAINPYFCDYVALALLNRADLYAANVKNYINWHFDHLNNDGTIYDYYMDGEEEKTDNFYDSTDSYAATFLTVLDKYLEKTGEVSFITEHGEEILKVYNAMISTLYGNLTYAKSDYQVIYTMDNSEVYAGLLSAEKLFDALGNEATADECAVKAEALKAALEEKLWNNNGYYEGGINLDGNVAVPYIINQYYPSGSAQFFPIIFNLIESDKKSEIYNGVKRVFDISYFAEKEDYFAFLALAAATCEDADYLIKYTKQFTNTVVLATSTNPYLAVAINAAYTFVNSVN